MLAKASYDCMHARLQEPQQVAILHQKCIIANPHASLSRFGRGYSWSETVWFSPTGDTPVV